MGYTKNKRLNIQGTSIGAMLANAFLSDEATVYTKNGSDIIERGGTSIFKEASYVVKAITYSLVNEAGILNWEGKPIQNTTIDNILRRFTTTFAYIWFTGGDIGKSHADFFIVTKNGILKNSKELLDANTYFISMSSILEKALNSLERTEAFFGKVSYSKPIIDKNTMNNIKELKSEKKEKELDFLMFNTSKIIIDKISKVEKNKGSKSIEINNYGILVG